MYIKQNAKVPWLFDAIFTGNGEGPLSANKHTK